MDINSLTIREARELAATFHNISTQATPFEVGKSYFIRTVTYHLTGRVERICGGFLVLSSAAWIADSGPFSDALLKGILSEVEPTPVAFVAIHAITDAFPWLHALPSEQK